MLADEIAPRSTQSIARPTSPMPALCALLARLIRHSGYGKTPSTAFMDVTVAADGKGVVAVGVLETTVVDAGKKEEETECGECR